MAISDRLPGMLRILQLISRDPQSCGLQALRGSMILADNSTEECRSLVLTIGRGGDYRNAAEAAIRLRFAHAFNIIHAWDPPALMAALGSGLPVAFSAPDRTSRGTWSWLAAMAYRDVHVVADSGTARNRLLRAGLPAERCHAITPGIDLDRIRQGRDDHLRKELGFAPDDRVVLAAGESTAAADHKLALHATSILHVLDPRHRILLWGRGRETRSIARLGARLRQPNVVVDAERKLGHPIEFERLLSAADLALITGTNSAPTLPIALCAAAALPIVAVKTPLSCEILTPQSAAIVPSRSPRLLAQWMLELFERPAEAQELGRFAQTSALQRFSESAFVTATHAFYSTLSVTPAVSVRRVTA
jgi:glycosyltransferase involved in cell wall biosynthesis